MALMVVCGLIVLTGLAAIVLWGSLDVRRPWPLPPADEAWSPGLIARRFVWYVTLAVVSGLGAGL